MSLASNIQLPEFSWRTLPKTMLMRVIKATLTWPTPRHWAETFGWLIFILVFAYGITWVNGWYEGRTSMALSMVPLVFAGAFFVPGVTEELFFRACCIPHRLEPISTRLRWVGFWISYILYVVVHPLNGYMNNHPLFLRLDYLVILSVLGLILSWVYYRSGSLWPPVLIHTTLVALFALLYGQ